VPIYEYRCVKNNKVFEAFQKVSDEALELCPTCRGPVEKRVSLGAFHLKGSGWYATDYKSKAPTEKSGSEKASEPAPKETVQKKESE